MPAEAPRFTGANPALLPPSSFTLNFTGADRGLLPPSFFIDVVTNCSKGTLSSWCLPYAAGYAAAGRATRISLIISDLGIFRVVKTTTLISVK